MFAIHPLRVESVAWVAERKDVLCALFFMLTLGTYVRYVRQTTRGRWLAVMIFFALGLMSKAMLVTLPFVLLLLDYWPLNRFDALADEPKWILIPRRLVVEKVPFLLLSIACSLITVFAQTDAIVADERLSLALRLGNAAMSYVAYLGQFFYPAGLVIFYPYPSGSIALTAVLSVLLLASVSAVCFRLRRRAPYLSVGWCWYLGMLVPVIGLIQVGAQSRADRYTYLPQIGVAMAVIWAISDACSAWSGRRAFLGGLGTLAIAILMVGAHAQTAYWHDKESLWKRVLAFNPDNGTANNNFGVYLRQTGRVDEAIIHYQKALAVQPWDSKAHNNFGNALQSKGRFQEAIAHYQQALALRPKYADAEFNLGNTLEETGLEDEAIAHFRKALAIKTDFAEALYGLGTAFLRRGEVNEAIANLRKALVINPAFADAHSNLGKVLLQIGRAEEAELHYQKALELQPSNVAFENNLALMLATSPQVSLRNGAKAVMLAEQANRLTGGANPVILHTLAAAYAEAGRFSEAIDTVNQALQAVKSMPNNSLAGVLRNEIALYRANTPLRAPGP